MAINIFQQVRNYLISIISLVVAISALSYNTYRNELTEENRNKRHAGFELLKELNALQLLIDYSHYDKDTSKGNPISGWGHLMYIADMGHLISPDMVIKAEQLRVIWGEHWQLVGENEASNQQITKSINALRLEVRAKMRALH